MVQGCFVFNLRTLDMVVLMEAGICGQHCLCFDVHTVVSIGWIVGHPDGSCVDYQATKVIEVSDYFSLDCSNKDVKGEKDNSESHVWSEVDSSYDSLAMSIWGNEVEKSSMTSKLLAFAIGSALAPTERIRAGFHWLAVISVGLYEVSLNILNLRDFWVIVICLLSIYLTDSSRILLKLSLSSSFWTFSFP